MALVLAYPKTVFEAPAHIIGTMMGLNDAIQSPDLQFQSSELIDDEPTTPVYCRWIAPKSRASRRICQPRAVI